MCRSFAAVFCVVLILPAWVSGEDTDAAFHLSPRMPFAAAADASGPGASDSGPMEVVLCPGEYEPASFVIEAGSKALRGVRVAAGDLVGPRGVAIAAVDAIDIRVVKLWYQGGEVEGFNSLRLVPELLLKDDALIETDRQNQRNIFHFEGIPVDGPQLQPVDVLPGRPKQFWLTIKAPQDAAPGRYTSRVTVTAADAEPREILLEVTVLPFDLVDHGKNFSIYYYGPTMFQYPPGREQTLAELRDMREHGLTSAAMYLYQYDTRVRKNAEGRWEVDLEPLREALNLRVEAGLTAPTVFSLAHYICRDTAFRRIWTADEGLTPENREKLADVIEQLEAFVADNDYPRLMYYGVDEPPASRIDRCERIFDAIRVAGGLTTTAVYDDQVEHLDNPIYALPMANGLYENPGQRTKPHRWRMHYWHPLENPSVDRFRYGVLTWRAGLDGACSYAYRHVFQTDNPYYDESLGAVNPKQNRDMMYTYPSRHGPIPTLQWEATREGIDDVRYLATLRFWVDRSRDVALTPELAHAIRRARTLLNRLTRPFTEDRPEKTGQYRYGRDLTAADFAELRHRVIERILELRSLLAETATTPDR